MGNSNCCDNSKERRNSDTFELDQRAMQRPYSERNWKARGETSVPMKFENYEATVEYVPKRDKVIVRSSKIFEDSNGRYATPFRKKIIKQIIMNEHEKIGGQFEDFPNQKFRQEAREKYGNDFDLQYVEPRDPYAYQEERKEGYQAIDLSNKRDLASGHSQGRQRPNRFRRDIDEIQEQVYLEDEDNEDQYHVVHSKRNDMNASRKNRQYHQANLHTDRGPYNRDYQQVANLVSKKTQTPIRETSNEAIQYNIDDIKNAKMRFTRMREERSSADIPIDPEEKLPFSTIRKRNPTDSESDQKILQDTPAFDEDEILEVIRENEQLQHLIINDPVLREKLYEKFSGMKHNASEHTFPHSFHSSKHNIDRRTQGDTNLFRTPMRSNEENADNRFSQFINSEFIGRDGTIYDRGTGYKVRGSEQVNEFNKDGNIDEKSDSEYYVSSKQKKRQNPDDEHEERSKNFSFRGKKKSQQLSFREKYQQMVSNSVEDDDIDQQLEREVDRDGQENSQNSQLIDYLIDGHPIDSKKSKMIKKNRNMRASVKRTSEYKQQYDESGTKYDPKTGKKIDRKREKVNIRSSYKSKGSENIGSDCSEEEKNYSSSKYSKGQYASKNSKKASGESMRSQGTGSIRSGAGHKTDRMFVQKLENDEGISAEESLDDYNKASKSKAISYKNPKYSSRKGSNEKRQKIDAADKMKQSPDNFERPMGEGNTNDVNYSLEFEKGKRSSEFSNSKKQEKQRKSDRHHERIYEGRNEGVQSPDESDPEALSKTKRDSKPGRHDKNQAYYLDE